MNRISPDTDLSPLLGKLVANIGLGQFQVILHLEDGLFISIEAECSFEQGNAVNGSEDYISLACNFAGLLGHRVEGARVVDSDKVVFAFSNGATLTIFDSNDQYESFQIQLPGKLVVV